MKGKKFFHNFRLFDGVSDELQDSRILIVDEDRIAGIDMAESKRQYPEYESVDLEGLTMLPGLMDLHIHITAAFMSDFANKDAIMQLDRQRELNFKNCIKYGLTTIRDMGAFPDSMKKWRKKIEKGKAVGPRIFTPLTFITSKDGPPERIPSLPGIIAKAFGGQFAERVNKPEQVKKIAEKNLKNGADFLKTQYATESMYYRGKLETLSDDCLEALRDVARDAGVKVAIHHTKNAGFRKAMKFDFNCLEHCSLENLEDRDIELFIKKGMAIVPTLKVNKSCFETDELLEWINGEGADDYMPDPTKQIIKSLETLAIRPYPPSDYMEKSYLDIGMSERGFDITLKNVERIKKAGGTIGVGTDSCGSAMHLFGFYWKELLYLTWAGFSNAEALKAATSVNAKILGIEDEFGSIEPGKYADFILVKGSPLEDLKAIRNIRQVFKGGVKMS